MTTEKEVGPNKRDRHHLYTTKKLKIGPQFTCFYFFVGQIFPSSLGPCQDVENVGRRPVRQRHLASRTRHFVHQPGRRSFQSRSTLTTLQRQQERVNTVLPHSEDTFSWRHGSEKTRSYGKKTRRRLKNMVKSCIRSRMEEHCEESTRSSTGRGKRSEETVKTKYQPISPSSYLELRTVTVQT